MDMVDNKKGYWYECGHCSNRVFASDKPPDMCSNCGGVSWIKQVDRVEFMKDQTSSEPREPLGFGSTFLVVGVPACGRLTTVQWGINLAAQKYPMNIAVEYCSSSDASEKQVGLARICISQIAQQMRAKFVWMLDDDV